MKNECLNIIGSIMNSKNKNQLVNDFIIDTFSVYKNCVSDIYIDLNKKDSLIQIYENKKTKLRNLCIEYKEKEKLNDFLEIMHKQKSSIIPQNRNW